MTADEIIAEIEPLGRESAKKVLRNHGVKEPFFGVHIGDLKKIQKRVKKDYRLALDLYATGIYDAMYLAGLIADESRMTKKDLRQWARTATCEALCAYTVPWVAAESPHGRELALEWIDARDASLHLIGWSTLGGLVAITEDEDLDLPELKRLLQRVEKTIHDQPDRVRYVMNGFVIAVGCYVAPLSDLAMRTAKKIGPVSVDMGNTDCKVPYAPDYIDKVRQRGTLGKKRKSAKC